MSQYRVTKKKTMNKFIAYKTLSHLNYKQNLLALYIPGKCFTVEEHI